MATQNCRSVKTDLARHLAKQVVVSSDRSQCAISLPIKTLDGRYVEVFVEEKIGDFVLVHDGGQATSELYVQGIHLTDAKRNVMAAIATRMGATFGRDDSFQVACKKEHSAAAILAIAQCASLAMYEVLGHVPAVEDELVSTRVRRTLGEWKQSVFEIKNHVTVKGRKTGSDHVFDSVAHGKDTGHKTVAVKVLAFGYGPHVQAQRYGFLALDLEKTAYDRWRRLAVVAKSDQWPQSDLELVRKLSRETLELRTGSEDTVVKRLPELVRHISTAA